MNLLGFLSWFGLWVLLPLAVIVISVVTLISLTERRRAGRPEGRSASLSGRTLAIGLFGFALIFGVALWWNQTHAWYEEVTGVDLVRADGREIPVSGYQGLDGNSPLKLRACFTVDPADFEGVPVATDATPLGTPDWFGCYDEAALTDDLAAGRATPYLAGNNEPQDFERIIAVYPDGRAYLWRQLNEKYRD
ncbi:DUF6446 family protein [Oceanicella sp. SM1341]|uniref:DUF6446 family protein n=1 Tax=Oceanicella sp. SM1341 TaxID=1548889 RepID=UPI000E46ADF6|nr:DUF6446 family protein [Oceanicella sp. SM1341]